MATGTIVLWDCQFTVSDWHLCLAVSSCWLSCSGSIHYLIQYECNCDLLEVGFHLVKDSLVAKYPIFCLRRPVLAPLSLTHECRNLLHLRMD